ncbi:MAG: M67 family metallopeptidase [Bacillota bacterium]|nr:M67 family metallopeptidase [Bacillota bacterium]
MKNFGRGDVFLIKCNDKTAEKIRKFGEGEYPNECCGLIFGKINKDGSKEINDILPIINAREDENKYNRFLITSKDMLKGELYARKNNTEIIGFYHSHPDHPAEPSKFDLDHAWPVYSYIIVSVVKGKSEKMTSWVLSSDRSSFQEEQII